jgi:hypothetical protein
VAYARPIAGVVGTISAAGFFAAGPLSSYRPTCGPSFIVGLTIGSLAWLMLQYGHRRCRVGDPPPCEAATRTLPLV